MYKFRRQPSIKQHLYDRRMDEPVKENGQVVSSVGEDRPEVWPNCISPKRGFTLNWNHQGEHASFRSVRLSWSMKPASGQTVEGSQQLHFFHDNSCSVHPTTGNLRISTYTCASSKGFPTVTFDKWNHIVFEAHDILEEDKATSTGRQVIRLTINGVTHEVEEDTFPTHCYRFIPPFLHSRSIYYMFCEGEYKNFHFETMQRNYSGISWTDEWKTRGRYNCEEGSGLVTYSHTGHIGTLTITQDPTTFWIKDEEFNGESWGDLYGYTVENGVNLPVDSENYMDFNGNYAQYRGPVAINGQLLGMGCFYGQGLSRIKLRDDMGVHSAINIDATFELIVQSENEDHYSNPILEMGYIGNHTTPVGTMFKMQPIAEQRFGLYYNRDGISAGATWIDIPISLGDHFKVRISNQVSDAPTRLNIAVENVTTGDYVEVWGPDTSLPVPEGNDWYIGGRHKVFNFKMSWQADAEGTMKSMTIPLDQHTGTVAEITSPNTNEIPAIIEDGGLAKDTWWGTQAVFSRRERLGIEQGNYWANLASGYIHYTNYDAPSLPAGTEITSLNIETEIKPRGYAEKENINLARRSLIHITRPVVGNNFIFRLNNTAQDPLDVSNIWLGVYDFNTGDTVHTLSFSLAGFNPGKWNKIRFEYVKDTHIRVYLNDLLVYNNESGINLQFVLGENLSSGSTAVNSLSQNDLFKYIKAEFNGYEYLSFEPDKDIGLKNTTNAGFTYESREGHFFSEVMLLDSEASIRKGYQGTNFLDTNPNNNPKIKGYIIRGREAIKK